MAFAHLTLATRDVEKTRDFFIRTLDWQPVPRPGNIGRQAAWLSMGPDQELHLVHVEAFEPSPYEKEFGRHVAIDYPLDGFEGLKKRLVQEGAELIDPVRETPFQRFFFREPNGYIFEVVDRNRDPE